MYNRIVELFIENFRALSGSNTFKFNDLNVYTGANNSGKSTVFNPDYAVSNKLLI